MHSRVRHFGHKQMVKEQCEQRPKTYLQALIRQEEQYMWNKLGLHNVDPYSIHKGMKVLLDNKNLQEIDSSHQAPRDVFRLGYKQSLIDRCPQGLVCSLAHTHLPQGAPH